MTHYEEFEPTALPAPVAGYVKAHARGDYAKAVTYLTDDARVVDDGRTLTGPAEVLEAFTGTQSEFSYTTKPRAQFVVDDNHVVVVNHLEGNFPGGEVDLRFQFTLRDGLISALSIEV